VYEKAALPGVTHLLLYASDTAIWLRAVVLPVRVRMFVSFKLVCAVFDFKTSTEISPKERTPEAGKPVDID
jgi:hypothetical protein